MPPNKQGYTLEIAGTPITFTTLDDLRFALASRVQAPLDKLDELEKLSNEALERQARGIRRVEHQITRMLGEAYEDPALLSTALREIELRTFSDDHDWRSIVAALNQCGSEYDEVRRLVLAKYLQYLASRQGLVTRIYSQREHERSEAHGADPRETAIFEMEELLPSQRDSSQADTRLPRGEPVRLRVSGDGAIVIYLSVHKFRLELGDTPQLVDENGATYPLPEGKIAVGRRPENDVVLDANFRGISRRHLIIERVEDDVVQMIDFSSHGTFVPRRALLG